jgi:hypothetical protein
MLTIIVNRPPRRATMMMNALWTAFGLVVSAFALDICHGLSLPSPPSKQAPSRREALQYLVSSIGSAAAVPLIAGTNVNVASAIDTPSELDVENFLRTGIVAQPMGVSGQV